MRARRTTLTAVAAAVLLLTAACGDAGSSGGATTAASASGSALTTWQQCTTSGQHSQYVTDVAEASGKAGVTGTPTVKINGKNITKTLTTPDALVAAVKAAKS